ncbi:transketolase [Marispirochaeta aestuarii]|uniref:transketolase n=1 Tax=Marispirochaeta aestuarii TaxID=1963862 RepID=UPI0029C7A2E0|nr:transketolase [Marispirochaeta aestuarii]
MHIDSLKAVALSVRALSMDGVQKANSGHPGLPMGCAELGALLYGEVLKHNPADSGWFDRDRFVLSAGHGSMFLYSLLHLSGYKLPLEELKKFRQLGSKTPGHPEYGWTDGVETTTGPLGAGFSNAVGMAIAESMLAAKFNTSEHKVVDHYTYALSGDGCMMEGITSEAASLAGHLGLGRLIVFYDSNKISIEGNTDITFTESVADRYRAYNWQVLEGDMYDFAGMAGLIEKAKAEGGKPSLIILKSVIGKGSPNKAGSHDVHGAPLGTDEVKATRKNLGIPEDAEFYIDPKAVEYFKSRKADFQDAQDEWQAVFDAWAKATPELKKEWDQWMAGTPDLSGIKWPEYKVGDSAATRSASGSAMKAIAAALGNFMGGSADLEPSNKTGLGQGDYSRENCSGRTLRFGVREHAMGGIANGIALHGGLRTFCATFLVFADYMRPPIRLANLMKLPVTYVFTHDSIYVGEDGPTHQPVEHLESLRIIPGMTVLRPGDGEETNVAWEMALEKTDGPVALALTRQNLSVYQKADKDWQKTMRKGAYIVKEVDGTPDVVLVATGSEVNLALKAADMSGKKVRVVSMPSRETFLKQDAAFRKAILPEGVKTVVAETGIVNGWEGIASNADSVLCMRSFGESGPAGDVEKYFGFVPENLAKLL